MRSIGEVNKSIYRHLGARGLVWPHRLLKCRSESRSGMSSWCSQFGSSFANATASARWRALFKSRLDWRPSNRRIAIEKPLHTKTTAPRLATAASASPATPNSYPVRRKRAQARGLRPVLSSLNCLTLSAFPCCLSMNSWETLSTCPPTLVSIDSIRVGSEVLGISVVIDFRPGDSRSTLCTNSSGVRQSVLVPSVGVSGCRALEASLRSPLQPPTGALCQSPCTADWKPRDRT